MSDLEKAKKALDMAEELIEAVNELPDNEHAIASEYIGGWIKKETALALLETDIETTQLYTKTGETLQ